MSTNNPDQPLACVVCRQALQPVFPGHEADGGYVQPDNANTFSTAGTYGSTVFDPVDGSYLEVNICDPCLASAIEAGLTRTYR